MYSACHLRLLFFKSFVLTKTLSCQIFNSFSHDVVVKNWNCCREQLQIGSKLLSWTPTRFETYLRYWRNLPFIVSRDFLFLSFKWCMILCKSVTKLRFDRLFLHFPSRASIFFLSHKLMIKQCIKSLKNHSANLLSRGPIFNTLFGQHRKWEFYDVRRGSQNALECQIWFCFICRLERLEVVVLPRLKRDIFHVFSIFLVSALVRVSLSIKALFFTTCTRNWFSKH